MPRAAVVRAADTGDGHATSHEIERVAFFILVMLECGIREFLLIVYHDIDPIGAQFIPEHFFDRSLQADMAQIVEALVEITQGNFRDFRRGSFGDKINAAADGGCDRQVPAFPPRVSGYADCRSREERYGRFFVKVFVNHNRTGLILYKKKIMFRPMVMHQSTCYGKCRVCSVVPESFRQVGCCLKVE